MAADNIKSTDLVEGTDNKDYPTPACVYDDKMGYYHDANMDPFGKMKAGTLPQPVKTEDKPFKL